MHSRPTCSLASTSSSVPRRSSSRGWTPARSERSALASAFPEEVAAVVRNPTVEGAARLAELRESVERFPRQAALKRILGRRGVPVREDVRAPLRGLTVEERDTLDLWHESLLEAKLEASA